MNEVQIAVQLIIDAAMRLIQADAHYWSDRPCSTCRAVSAIVGKPFGCYEYQRIRAQKEQGAAANVPPTAQSKQAT